jgi:hypothetical protein
MSNLQLQAAAAAAASGEGLVGSWPGAAGRHHHSASTTDAALPFFQGRPIRTGSSLSNMAAGVQRTSSFTGHPGSARGMGGHVSDGGFAGADQLCFGSCNSAPITPRSPSFGFGDEVGCGTPGFTKTHTIHRTSNQQLAQPQEAQAHEQQQWQQQEGYKVLG